MKNLFQCMTIVTVALIALTTSPAIAVGPRGGAGPGVASEWDCASACTDCESSCGKHPAGVARADCVRACGANAARCCVGYGKKPPGADCYCQ